MPRSFFQMYGHLIFSTKNRINYLDDNIRPRLHSYMATIFRNMGCPYVHVGGAEDHIHVLFDIGKNNLPINIVREVKKDTSKFIKNIGSKYQDFYWQNGYGLFSVSPANKEKVINYMMRKWNTIRLCHFRKNFAHI